MRNVLILLLFIFFYSCTDDKTEIFLIFNSGEGLEIETEVVLNNQKVGEITELDLTSTFETIATIHIDKKLSLSEDSKFFSQSVDLLTDAIVIYPGASKSLLQNGDTIIGQTSKRIDFDTVLTIINNAIENSAPMKKQDSLIMVIKELTDEVEGLK
ncbi:MAG TPA: hypothetical protein EYG86_10030 [Crocinitomicaceae bacterium]|nr:hypothetical protein [Crocinitomicaceae bacterium]